MKTFAKLAPLLPALALMAFGATHSEAASSSTYLSLGDGLGYGTGTTQDNGQGGPNAGFVSQYANSLAAMSGGTAPNVVNLALPGVSLANYNTTLPNYTANTNYYVAGTANGVPQSSQQDMFYHYALAAGANGSPVTNITLSLGMTDVTNILNAPGFSTMSLTQQSAAIQTGLSQISTEYASVLNSIHSLLPNAKIDLIGAYNPYNATPNNPLAASAESAILGLNSIIQSQAASTGATYINTYSAFLGKEGTYTNILSTGGIDPTAAGYSAIGQLLNASAVPEPSSIFLATVGLLGLAGHTWRRRRNAA